MDSIRNVYTCSFTVCLTMLSVIHTLSNGSAIIEQRIEMNGDCSASIIFRRTRETMKPLIQHGRSLGPDLAQGLRRRNAGHSTVTAVFPSLT
jgi:hypothetical protein